MKNSFEEASELDGYDELKEEDQAKVVKAWEEGHVADEDIPESARKEGDGEGDEDDEEDKPKKKKAAPKKKKADDEDGEVEKPKRSRATKKVFIFFIAGHALLSHFLDG